MNSIKHYNHNVTLCKIVLLCGLFLYGNNFILNMTAIGIFILMVIRSSNIEAETHLRILLITLYAIILLVHISIFSTNLLYPRGTILYLLSRGVAISLLTLPYLIENIITIKKYTSFYLPSTEEIKSISFYEMRSIKLNVHHNIEDLKQVGQSLRPHNVYELIVDIPRHSSIKYVNEGYLTEEYFRVAYDSLVDPYIYIVISDTGSPASELISIFTKKEYNHSSIAFDKDLKTIISYNGGENVYPPGLNHEIVQQFNKKEDAAVLVYRLKTTRAQKELLIDKVKEINKEGSAYNLLGLIFKQSMKPNIMFCSQFVYSMLQMADLDYFKKRPSDVKPNDFIEMDYYRKLEFVYKITFEDEIIETYNEHQCVEV